MRPGVSVFTGMCAMLLGIAVHAQELRSVSISGLEITYPAGEKAIVSRVAEAVPGMLGFLREKGLPVKTPVHVFLDDDLDLPDVQVNMIPHRGIHIPLRAPGVFEEGYLQEDPWTYFLFKGLCLQGVYSVRGGLPGSLHAVFGEVSSPNLVNPPWLLEGISSLLYRQYSPEAREDPFEETLLKVPVPADISKMSNHPDAWPGYFGYRIYGKPFIAWLHGRYGWDALLRFLASQGSSLLPVEIELKARDVFGTGWVTLWDEFMEEAGLLKGTNGMEPVSGFVPGPFITWNHAGVDPGIKRVRHRGRYGYYGENSTLWLSEYDREGIVHVIGYPSTGSSVALDMDHLWDPGPGNVAVTRVGSRPHLMVFEKGAGVLETQLRGGRLIPAPGQVMALSGPVMDTHGRVAVSANSGGNWDIWVYDGSWLRITDGPSIEADPWWVGDTLVFSSNTDGSFQLYTSAMVPLTRCEKGAFLPRSGKYMCLTGHGWSFDDYGVDVYAAPVGQRQRALMKDRSELPSTPYSPWDSICPNFMAPDLYVGLSDVQVGLATWGHDVTGDYGVSAGARWSFAHDYLALRAGVILDELSLQLTRYPFVSDPVVGIKTEESRLEYRLTWAPELPDWLSLSVDVLDYGPLEDLGEDDVEVSGVLGVSEEYESLYFRAAFESCSAGRTSLFGGFRWIVGSDVYAVVDGEAGRTWGGYTFGHGSYRVGGDVGEGYFTSRPSRLFPVRGFGANLLEADKAVTTGLEVFWPLANIQRGHGTLPLFLHRLWLGTFVDAGLCADSMGMDDTLAGAGFEVVTSFEVAWGNLSSFRMGVAWPVRQPGYLDEEGPLLVVQIGRPL